MSVFDAMLDTVNEIKVLCSKAVCKHVILLLKETAWYRTQELRLQNKFHYYLLFLYACNIPNRSLPKVKHSSFDLCLKMTFSKFWVILNYLSDFNLKKQANKIPCFSELE